MNRRRYDNNRARFDKSSDRRDGNYSYSRVNPKDDYKGRYGNSSKYFDDSKYSRSFKSHYKNSSRSDGDRLKRSRNDDSRHNSSFLSPRRNDLRPKTPPPPSIRSSGNNYHNYHNHRGSRNDSSYRNSFSPTSASRKRQSQRNVASYRNSTRLRPNSIRDSDSRRPKGIIRRKVIVSSSRKIHSMRNERTRMIRLARIKRNKDSLKIKNNASSKKSKEDHSDDDHSENKRNSSNNECENEDKKSSSKKNGQDLNCKDKEVKEGDEKSSEDKSKEGNNEEDSSESRRNRSSKRESISPERNNKPFIKLICVHCRIKCRTFSEYQSHLYSRTHRIAMRRVGVRQKAQLSRMRLEQRNVQRDLEENAKEDLGDQQYCLLCRLNYKTGKAKHQLSDHHKIMKKFLMPYCSTCHIAFKSPIVYQSHRCSLEHIKRKARDNKSDSEDSGSEMKVDLKEFTTVDSIGEIDDDIEGSDEEMDTSEFSDEMLGVKFVKKVEAIYCEQCDTYISHDFVDEEEVIYKHCKTKLHLKLTKNKLELESKTKSDETMEEEIEIKKEEGLDDDNLKENQENESNKSNDKITEENNEEEDEEPVLNIDIQSEKNCTDNEINEEMVAINETN